MRLLLLALFACTGSEKIDTAEPDETDTDEDTEDTDPRSASISGTVLHWDGTPAVDMEVQVCSLICRYTATEARGNLSQGGLEGNLFKVDSIGTSYSIAGYGNGLVGVDLAPAEQFVITPAMVAPPVGSPVMVQEDAGSATYELGQVSLTFAASSMEFLFGVVDSKTHDFALQAGVLEGAAVPALFSVTPSFVVDLLPWGTEGGALDVVVTGLTSPDGTYNVYALEEYGAVEGPLGTATVSAGTATATGIQPSVWTWLLFVPA